VILVQKYGGATLADPDRIKKAAASVQQKWKAGHQIVVVVSAMGKTTNELIKLADQVSASPNRREMDMLLSAGERISMSLFSMALHDLKVPAVSFTGSQAGILTNEDHSAADIIDVKAPRVEEALAQGRVVVLAGFQGVSPKTKEITTLGRGGSDLTAVAMCAAFKADRCEILKDVAGVFSADPRWVPDAIVIPQLTYDEFSEMTFCGAQVLQHRAVEYARQKQVRLWIGSASTHGNGTFIHDFVPEPRAKLLSVNSHQEVLRVKNIADESGLKSACSDAQIVSPDFFHKEGPHSFLAGPSEVLRDYQKKFGSEEIISSVSVQASSLCEDWSVFEKSARDILFCRRTEKSFTVFVRSENRTDVLRKWHRILNSMSLQLVGK